MIVELRHLRQDQAESVLEELRRRTQTDFSSHDFIRIYCAQNEDDYLDWLCEYRGTNRAFENVHKAIGRFLADNQRELRPRYHEIGHRKSETIHRTIDEPMWWAWD